MNLEELIIHHEGFRDTAYKCTEGFLTIGVGHKILPTDKFKEGVKYNKEQLMEVFRTDLANAKFYAKIDDVMLDTPFESQSDTRFVGRIS